MTKTEYRDYIASEDWRRRRIRFIGTQPFCMRCDMPRPIAIIAYDQDLHVHHKSYAHLGAETWADLEILDRRCHEIETFGSSQLHQVSTRKCIVCDGAIWGLYGDEFDDICCRCSFVVHGPSPRALETPSPFSGVPCWEKAVWSSLWLFGKDEVDRVIAEYLEAHRNGPKNLREDVAQFIANGRTA